MAGDDVTIRIRADNQTGTAFNAVRGQMNGLSTAAGRLSSSIGQGGAGSPGLAGAIAGLAVVGTSLLPAIGALVPMMAGAGVAAGTAALAFNGVGEAMQLAGQDQEKYREALKKMGPEQREFTKTLVAGKKEFAGFGKEVQKLALPGFTAGLKAAAPAADTLKGAMRDMAGVLGDLGRDAGEFIGSQRFRESLRANFDLGAGFVDRFTRSLGPFTQSLLDFGAASGPSLRAFTDGLSGLMSSSLPGFFDGLTSGIGGAADTLDGLFYTVDRLLPSFGELSGAIAKAFGPVFKELFEGSADRISGLLSAIAVGLRITAPVFKDLAFGIRLSNEVLRMFAGTARDIAGVLVDSFLPAVGSVDKARGPFERLYDAFKRNEGTFREAGRVFAGLVLDMVTIALENLPRIVAVFNVLGRGVLNVLGAFIGGAAKAFGWIPGIGPKLKDAAKGFDIFAEDAKRGMDKAGKDISEFSASVLPRLRDNRLRMDIRNWQDQIKRAKQQISDGNLPPKKRARLEADIKAWERNIAIAKRSIGGVKGVARRITVSSNATAAAGAVARALRGIPDENVYVRVSRVGLGEVARALPSADGNLFRSVSFANGSENHVAQISRPTMRVWAEPETGGEAYIPLSPAKRTRSVAILEDVAERFGYGLEKFARGGLSKAARAKAAREAAKREREARNSLVGDLTISRFGQVAGAKRTEFRSALARPSDISGLVNTLNQWRSNIAKATHGGVERRLLRSLDTAGRSLLKYAKSHDKVSADLDKARSKLSDLRSAASQLRDSVASGIKGAANVTGMAGGGGRVTLGGVMAGLTSARDQSGAFAGALSTLRKRGLSKDILADIAGAGLDGGLSTAQALMGASKSDIALMNKLQGQIASNAKKAGTTTADAMFAAGIKAAEGVVKGLEKNKSKLEKAMDGVASALEKAIKKALGVKGRAHGGVTGAAGGGPRSGLTLVGEQGWELLDLPAGSRVRTHGDSRRMLAAGGGGGSQRPIELVVNLDGRTIVRQIFNPFREEIRDRGGLAALGRP